DTLFIERFVTRPRHIEVQVLADNHGNVIHLGERECSLQRRHQKIIEEAPSPLLDEATRQRIGQAAVQTARSVNYSGAGTVEFIVSADAPDEFFFMEMNTRLQVEHPVTEMVTGIDLVEQQLLAAAGVRLGIAQSQVTMTGHAIEARVYAENPARGFLPTGGTVLHLSEPSGEHVRVDSSLQNGSDVGTTYDPMLAKVIAWGADRSQALSRLDRALGADCILGVQTNLRFLRSLINFPAVIAGELDTEMVGREIDSLIDTDTPDAAYVGYIYAKWSDIGSGGGPWDSATGWRSGRPAAPLRWKCKNQNGDVVDLTLQVTPAHLTARIGANDPIEITMSPVGERVLISIDGIGSTATVACAGEVTWVHVEGVITALTDVAPERADTEESSSGGEVRSPMPGTIIAVHVQAGAEVSKGNPLVVVEAMKMEHSLVAPIDGITSDFNLAPGQQVAVDQLLLTVAPAIAVLEEN
ncbi:MAG: biotin/lipoyl-containing protein, partial [Antricoccus sp.]